jgi:DNA-binding NarL/FixJ family response regulator
MTQFKRQIREDKKPFGDKPQPESCRERIIPLSEKCNRLSTTQISVQDYNALLSLTVQEFRLLELLAEGMDNKTMATHLHISENTVECELQGLFRKFKVQGRIQLMVKIWSWNIGRRMA